MRLSRIAALCSGVKRPAIDVPARWTTASTPANRSGAGPSGFHCRSSLPRAGRRTRRITRCPPVVRNAVSAEPTSPDAPVTATVSGCAPASAASRCAAQVVGELSVAVDEGGAQRRRGHRGVDAIAHQGAALRVAELVGVAPPADRHGPARTSGRPRTARRRSGAADRSPPDRAGPPIAARRADPAPPRPSASDSVSDSTVIGCHGGTSRVIAPAGCARRTPRPTDGRRCFRIRCPCLLPAAVAN